MRRVPLLLELPVVAWRRLAVLDRSSSCSFSSPLSWVSSRQDLESVGINVWTDSKVRIKATEEEDDEPESS